jgi:hypothetical protein
MDRDFRALSRNRQTRESYFLDCASSRDARKRAKGVENAKRYMSERQCTLTANCKVYEKQIVNLLDAIHGCKTYTKVIKAKYVDLPGELIDLTDEPDFTLETISQTQLARVGSQCDAVYRMLEALKNESDEGIGADRSWFEGYSWIAWCSGSHRGVLRQEENFAARKLKCRLLLTKLAKT